MKRLLALFLLAMASTSFAKCNLYLSFNIVEDQVYVTLDEGPSNSRDDSGSLHVSTFGKTCDELLLELPNQKPTALISGIEVPVQYILQRQCNSKKSLEIALGEIPSTASNVYASKSSMSERAEVHEHFITYMDSGENLAKKITVDSETCQIVRNSRAGMVKIRE